MTQLGVIPFDESELPLDGPVISQGYWYSSMNDHDSDDILGIIRCARCGQRLEGEIECPFCSAFPDRPQKERIPKWVYITACFFTSPLSLYPIITSDKLSLPEKFISFSGCLLWFGVYRFWFWYLLPMKTGACLESPASLLFSQFAVLIETDNNRSIFCCVLFKCGLYWSLFLNQLYSYYKWTVDFLSNYF